MEFNPLKWFRRDDEPADQTPDRPEAAQPGDDTAWLFTQDGNVTLIRGGQTFMIGTGHPNFDRIMGVLREGTGFDRLDRLVDVTASIAEIGNVTVGQYGQVFYEGEQLQNGLTERITRFVRDGLPFEPLARFLDNLMANPSEVSRNELYSFLENQGIPITPDGCFMAYKGIKEDWTDCYTGTIKNEVGEVVEMDRELVDDNRDRTCSNGLHVAALSYASSWARGRIVLVKVNPRDAVSVPSDHNAEKLRVCRYEVVSEAEAELTMALYEREQEAEEAAYVPVSSEGEILTDDEQATGRKRGQGGRFLPRTAAPAATIVDDDDYDDDYDDDPYDDDDDTPF